MMASLSQSGRFEMPVQMLTRITDEFDAYRTGETGTAKEMARVWKDCGVLIDPHTAVAVHAARKALAHDPSTPMVALSTAHPAKFGAAVEKATGQTPALPAHLAGLMEKAERFTVLANDQAIVEAFVRERARAAR